MEKIFLIIILVIISNWLVIQDCYAERTIVFNKVKNLNIQVLFNQQADVPESKLYYPIVVILAGSPSSDTNLTYNIRDTLVIGSPRETEYTPKSFILL